MTARPDEEDQLVAGDQSSMDTKLIESVNKDIDTFKAGKLKKEDGINLMENIEKLNIPLPNDDLLKLRTLLENVTKNDEILTQLNTFSTLTQGQQDPLELNHNVQMS